MGRGCDHDDGSEGKGASWEIGLLDIAKELSKSCRSERVVIAKVCDSGSSITYTDCTLVTRRKRSLTWRGTSWEIHRMDSVTKELLKSLSASCDCQGT
jgi:hypothetical protein